MLLLEHLVLLLDLAQPHSLTRPYRPQAGKAERFIQTCLRELAYTRSYANSAERTAWLSAILAYYNTRRPHAALGYSRQLPASAGAAYCNLTTSWFNCSCSCSSLLASSTDIGMPNR